jgi:hypothetical protein
MIIFIFHFINEYKIIFLFLLMIKYILNQAAFGLQTYLF